MVAFLQVVFGVGDWYAGTPAGDARHNPGRGHVRLQQIAARLGHHLLQARQRRGQERERFERAGGRVRPVVERRCPGRACALAQAVEREALGGDGGSERVLPGGDVGESIGELAPVQVGERIHEEPFRAAETEALDHDGDVVGGEGVTQGDDRFCHTMLGGWKLGSISSLNMEGTLITMAASTTKVASMETRSRSKR